MDIDTPDIEVVQPSQLAVIERAQVDIQIETAKKYPRILSKVKSRMTEYATLDEDTAASCFYTVPRGGRNIQGPSIRMAEIAISSFGNLRAETRVVDVIPNGPNPVAIVQATVHDLETNTAIRMEKRRRITKKKSKDAPDEDDINNAVNACSAIALRDSVFKVVPLSLVKPVVELAKKVAIGDARSFNAQRLKVVDRLKQMGAKEDFVYAAVGAKRIEDVDEDRLAQLIGLGTSIKNGDITIEEAFPDVKREVETVGMFKNSPAQAPAQPESKKPVLPPEQPKSNVVSETAVNPDGSTTYTGPSSPTPVTTPRKRAVKPPTPPTPVATTPQLQLAHACASRNLAWPAFCEAAGNCNYGGLDTFGNDFADLPAEVATEILGVISDVFQAAGV